MNKKTIDKKNIFSLFNTLLTTMFLATLLESFTYAGFVLRHFNQVWGIGVLFMVPLIFLVFKKIYNTNILKNILMLLSFFMVCIYCTIDLLDKVLYSNFVFSRLHIQPYLFLLPTLLISCAFLVNNVKKRKIDLFLHAALLLVLISFLIIDGRNIVRKLGKYKLENLRLGYDQKMEMIIGKITFNYIGFIKENTPENSTILVPPMAYPWPQIGNIAYIRYFLYPREFINGGEKDPKINTKDIDFVLIDYGEDSSLFEYGYTNVWPKFNVEAEYIIYWNPRDLTSKRIDNVDYVYQEGEDSENWGVIKVKK